MSWEGTRVAGSVGRAGGAARTVTPPPMISPTRVLLGAPRRVSSSRNTTINLDINIVINTTHITWLKVLKSIIKKSEHKTGAVTSQLVKLK